ncbi:hypothetical protein MASR2M79_04990 [Aminivibrio sp.]
MEWVSFRAPSAMDRGTVLAVAYGLIEASNLGAHLLADGKPCCVVCCAVDPKAVDSFSMDF